MLLHALFDTNIFVSAFLRPQGVAGILLNAAQQQAYSCTLAMDIIEETREALGYPHIQERYQYSAEDSTAFCEALRASFPLVTPATTVTGVSRDPGDDFILACAVAAHVTHLVTRDKDLLVLETYQDIAIVTPEEFIAILRAADLLP